MQIRLTIILVLIFTSAKLFPQQPDSILMLAKQNFKEEKYTEAIEQFTRASQTAQLNNEDLFIFGKAYYKNREYTKAVEIFKELTQKENPEVDAYYYLANTLCHTDPAENFPMAKPFFETYINKAENDTTGRQEKLREAYHYLCSFYLYNNPPYYDSVIYNSNKLLALSLTKNKYEIVAYSCLALSNFHIGNYKNAELSCSKLNDINPDNKSSKELLRVIKEMRRKSSLRYWQTKINADTTFNSVKEAIGQNFDLYFDKKFIPSSLMDTIKIWVSSFKLANPGEPWEISDVITNHSNPTRQLLFILKNNDHIFIVYKHGGLGVCNQYIWAKLNHEHILDIRAQSTLKEINNVEKFRKYILNSTPEGVYLEFL